LHMATANASIDSPTAISKSSNISISDLFLRVYRISAIGKDPAAAAAESIITYIRSLFNILTGKDGLENKMIAG